MKLVKFPGKIVVLCLVTNFTRSFSKKLTMQNIENMRSTEDMRYIIVEADERYFGFDLDDEVEQGSIYSIIQSKHDYDFISGWMVSKVMPLWVGTYDDWLAFEEQVIQVKIPQFLSYYNDSDKSSRKSDSSRSDTSENTFSDTDNVVSRPRKRLEKQSNYIMSGSDADADADDDVDDEPLETKLIPICDWAIEGRCTQSIVPKKCQHSGGCDKYVHHLCTIEWAQDNNIDESSILTLCRKHHPEYQYHIKQLQSDGHKGTLEGHYPEEANEDKDSSRKSKTEKSPGKYSHRKENHSKKGFKASEQVTGKHSNKEPCDSIKPTDKDIEEENGDDDPTTENDPNYDIFKSDLFGASLTKHIKEIQPKKILAMLNSMFLQHL